MTADRWREVSRIYGAVVTKPDADRPAALASLCANDAELRREVESLLASGQDLALLDRAATEHPSTLGLLSENPIGSRIGMFRIDALLGVGGMGEVYRARDTKLNRDVAIKILPPAFADDPERLARFKREAQLLAALNHPNIGGIYGFEDSGPVHALVLELVEGPTLADRITHGSLPIEESLAIARQIADALECAHEQGVIHRDLKPANINVRDDGTVKVLDFGLAKMLEPTMSGAGPVSVVTQSPTITTPAMTAAGMILGTAAYMSPEQAKGKPADKRSDIWAFGCVLYEMLAGERPFKGDDVADTLAVILRGEPDWTLLPRKASAALRSVLVRCLRKDIRRRFQHIGDVRNELEESTSNPSGGQSEGGSRPVSPLWLAGAAALAVGLVGAGWMASDRARSPVRPADEMRVDITTPPAFDLESFALSPDGLQIVFAATAEGRSQLFVRALDSTAARAIPGTDNALLPFWSPDGGKVGFFADARLKVTDTNGRAIRVLASAVAPGGAWWDPSGFILFSPNSGNGAIARVPQDGGTITPASIYQSSVGDRFPQMLPDGKRMLYTSGGQGPTENVRSLYVAVLDPPQRGTRILDADRGWYVDGKLFYIRQGSLFTQRFDVRTLTLLGEPTPIASNIAYRIGGALSMHTPDRIAYRAGGLPNLVQFAWFDRSGRELAKVGEPFVGTGSVSLSRDGTAALLQRTTANNTDIWQLDTVRGSFNRLTTHPSIDAAPVWSPDGRRFVFSSSRGGGAEVVSLFLHEADGSERTLYKTSHGTMPADWSSDGFILFRDIDLTTGRNDIAAIAVDGDHKPFPVADTPFDEMYAQFSPDGRWVAYQSNESGRFEIYIQPFRRAGQKWPVSTGGGTQVRWSGKGDELFFVGPDGRLMASRVTLPAGTEPPAIASPIALPLGDIRTPAFFGRTEYAVAPDGRFLLMLRPNEIKTPPITLILNWRPPSGPAPR